MTGEAVRQVAMVTVLVVGGGAALRLAWRWSRWVRAGRPAVPQVFGSPACISRWRRRSLVGWAAVWAVQVLGATLDARAGGDGLGDVGQTASAWGAIVTVGATATLWWLSSVERETGHASEAGGGVSLRPDGAAGGGEPRSGRTPRR